MAAVENRFGQGRTLLIGSFPGAGYYLHHGAATKELFVGFLKVAGVTPQVTVDDDTVQARLHQGEGGTHLWVTNPTRTPKKVTVTLAMGSSIAEDVWGMRSDCAEWPAIHDDYPGARRGGCDVAVGPSGIRLRSSA